MNQTSNPPLQEGRKLSDHFGVAARRKYTAKENIRIVLEGFGREVAVNDLCRREGIKPHSFYAWTKELMGLGGSGWPETP